MSDLTIYAGNWVALLGDQVAGVGHTAEEAKRQARRNRPRDRFVLRFVESKEGGILPLPALLTRLQRFWQTLDQPVYLVGGVVRDALLGKVNADLDFVTDANGIKLAFWVGDWLRMPAFPLDKSRDTGRVVAEEKVYLDFSVYRGGSLEEDLRHRDFTINGMALPASACYAGNLIDPLGGIADLSAGIVRLASPTAIADDPIRALRGVRFATQLHFQLEQNTKEAMRESGGNLGKMSGERVRDELLKMWQTAEPDRALHLLAELDLLTVVLPEISALAKVEQSPPHHEPVLAHTARLMRWLAWLEGVLFERDGWYGEMPAFANSVQSELQELFSPFVQSLTTHLARHVVGGLTGWQLLRWGALWHDAGKATTQTLDDAGKIRFFGHEEAGARLVKGRLTQLKFSRESRDGIAGIVAGHMRPFLLARNDTISRRAIYRFFRAYDSAGLDICLVSLADHLATYDNGEQTHFETGRDQWERLLRVVEQAFATYFNQFEQVVKPPPLLRGDELMTALNLSPGPEVGRLLRLIEEGQATGEISTKEDALNFARQAH